MLMPRYLRFLALFTIYEISTQPCVHGRPSPAAIYDLLSTTMPYEAATYPSRGIPGLTPEESLDVVEKILHGELQPVMKTEYLKSVAPDVTEVPIPINRPNTKSTDTPQHFDKPMPYFELPHTRVRFSEQVLPTVATPYQVPLSLSQSTDWGIRSSPDSYLPTDEIREKGTTPVTSVKFIPQSSNDDVRFPSQDLQLESTQKSQILPETADTDLIDDKPVPSKRSLPSLHAENLVLDGQTIPMKSTKDSSVFRDPGEDSLVFPDSSGKSVHDFQGLSEIMDTGIKAVQSVSPEFTFKTVSTDDSALDAQGILGKTDTVDTSASRDLPRLSIQNVQDLPKTVDTGIINNNPAYPKHTVQAKLTDDALLNGQTAPVQSTSDSFDIQDHGKNSSVYQVLRGKSIEDVQDLSESIDSGTSYNNPVDSTRTNQGVPTNDSIVHGEAVPMKSTKNLSDIPYSGKDPSAPRDLIQDVHIDDSLLDGQTIPEKITKDSFDVQDHGKYSSVSEDLPGKSIENSRGLSVSLNRGITADRLVSLKRTLQTLPPDESVLDEQVISVKSTDPFVSQGNTKYSTVPQDFRAKLAQDVPNFSENVGSTIIDDKPDYSKLTSQDAPTDDLVLNSQDIPVRSIGLKHTDGSHNVQDFLDPTGYETKDDTATFSEDIVPAVATDKPGFAKVKERMTGRTPGVPFNIYDIPVFTSNRMVQTDIPKISDSGFVSFKRPPLIDPRTLLSQDSKPVKNLAMTLLPKNLGVPSKRANKLIESVSIDPVIQFREAQSLSDLRGKAVEGPEKSTTARKATFPKKDFAGFRNVDTDLLALSAGLYSDADSKSDEYPWSYEDSEEDDEFWTKMKKFMNNESERNSAVPEQLDEVQFDSTISPTNSLGRINAIPLSETKPNDVQNLHVMKIPKSMQKNSVPEVRCEFDGSLENAQDWDYQTSSDFPVQPESSTLSYNDGYSTTEATTSEPDILLKDTSDESNRNVGEFYPDEMMTTEILNYPVSTTEQQDYKDGPELLNHDTAKNDQQENEESPEEDTIDSIWASTSNYETDNSITFVNNQSFRKDPPKRSARDNIFPSSRYVISRSVGGPDDVPELKNPVSPQDDPRFSESITEYFTTDEPLLAEEDTPVEYSTKWPASVLEQETEFPSQPTDLNSIEAESPAPASISSGHFVSKKDDPMNTVAYLLPAADDKSANKNMRIRRSNNYTKDRPEERSLNDTLTSANPISSSTVVKPVNFTIAPPIPPTSTTRIPTLQTSPSIIKTSQSPNYLPSTSSVTQFSFTTPATSDLLTSTVPKSPSTQSTTLTPSTTPVTISVHSNKSTTATPTSTTPDPPTNFDLLTSTVPKSPSTQSTTLTPSTTPVTISVHSNKSTTATPTSTIPDPPTTFELLPTPIPETSTTPSSITPLPASTNSTAPKKKKMVWKIPFYPNNVAITSSGEVRLEPKDKLATTTTSKPLLRNRLKPEDIQAARERLLRRFHIRRPATVPLSDAARAGRLRQQTGQVSVPNAANRGSIGVHAGRPSVRPLVSDDVLAYVTAVDPSQLPSLLYNSPKEREEARKRRLRSMVGLAGDVRSLFSDRARHAVRTVGNIVGGGSDKKESQ